MYSVLNGSQTADSSIETESAVVIIFFESDKSERIIFNGFYIRFVFGFINVVFVRDFGGTDVGIRAVGYRRLCLQ